MPFGYGLYTLLKNSAAARWALIAGAVVVLFFAWLLRHDALVRKADRMRAEARARKTAKKVLTEMKEESDDRIDKAERRAEAIANRPEPPAGATRVDELPEQIRRLLIRP